MNDRAEQAFRDAFAEHGAEHIEPVPARRRLDARWAVAAALAVVAVAVPVALALQGRGGPVTDPVVESTTVTMPNPASNGPVPSATADPTPPDTATTTLSGLPPAKEGWRWVSRGDIAVQAPEDWPYESYSWMPWCLDGVTIPEGPYVDSPGGPTPDIGCGGEPPKSVPMHVGFGTAPGINEVIARSAGSSQVYVVLDENPTDEERALAEEILATATTFERDASGCSPFGPLTSPEDRPEAWDLAAATGIHTIGICRYEDNARNPGTPNLVGSRTLSSEEEVTNLVDGIAGAPEGVSGNPDDCLAGYDERAGVVLRMAGTDEVREVYLRADGCRNLGFDDGTTRRQLSDACQLVFGVDPVRLDSASRDTAEPCLRDR